ncbi:MAG: response regulator [Paracoccaceae bacterium]
MDDDEIFQYVLIETLKSLGQEDTRSASSGAEALALVQSEDVPFDCILLDIQMHGMDGVELCQVLRGLPLYRQVPIVMITSQSSKQFIDDAFAAGATDYVTKPLDRLEFKARIGMAARLVEERQQLAMLTRKVGQLSDNLRMQIEFDTPILVPGFERGIEYLALENYLLTLGKKRMLSMSAFGFHIANADIIFDKTSRANFVDMLGDVAINISDAIKTEEVLIAYAGYGNFVGVTNSKFTQAPEEMSAMIECGMADFKDFYASEMLPMPRVMVGRLLKSSFFSLDTPTRILERAINLAQTSRNTKLSLTEHAA